MYACVISSTSKTNEIFKATVSVFYVKCFWIFLICWKFKSLWWAPFRVKSKMLLIIISRWFWISSWCKALVTAYLKLSSSFVFKAIRNEIQRKFHLYLRYFMKALILSINLITERWRHYYLPFLWCFFLIVRLVL